MMRIALVIAGLLAFFPAAAQDTEASLDEIVLLARGGAPTLALRLLDRYQSTPDLTPESWARAERERILILGARADWRTLAERVAGHPEDLPQAFRDWAAGQHARALVSSGDGGGARSVLRRAIWEWRPPDAATLREWRAIIIRSHLVEGGLDAALIALRRYTQDYGADEPVLRALHGEALVRAERPGDALSVIGDTDAEPLASLRALAALRAGSVPAGTAFERAVRTGSARDADTSTRHAAWRIAAEAAERLDNSGASVAALERALAVGHDDALPAVLRVEPARLWSAYEAWGQAIGNAEQLIVGIDQPWLDTAAAAPEAIRARALHATLAAHTHADSVAAFAHHRIAQSLLAEAGGDRVLAALYLRGGRFERPESIPAQVRYALVDEVLRDGDVALASRLIADLEMPPADVDAAEWALRRARVLVLAGRRSDGVGVLMRLLEGGGDYDVDRLLQVVFDLQSAGAHREALRVFERVYAREELGVQQRREVLFWVAESYDALEEHAQAARLYLRSAGFEDPYSMDPWAQTARYRAALALARAGLREDAVIILRGLLNATRDAGRQSVLRHEIEQLSRLMPSDDGSR